MRIDEIKQNVPSELFARIKRFDSFLPSQEKAIKSGLLENDKNLLICTPTASGKTLIAEIAGMKAIFENLGKAIYVAPLKALAMEKFNQIKELYGDDLKIGLSIGDVDSEDQKISNFDFIVTTSEKLDSDIRHNPGLLREVKVVIIDEIHLLHDSSRGPTLEVLITIIKEMVKDIRIIGLSATIGNAKDLSKWLSAELVLDTWRPVELRKGIYLDGDIEFFKN